VTSSTTKIQTKLDQKIISFICHNYRPHKLRGPGSVVGIATGYGLDGSGIASRWGARFFAPVQFGPGAHPASYTMRTGSFSGVKSGRGVTLTPHPLLIPWSRKSRAIPLLPLWAVRPVQSLSACTRVHFAFTFYTNSDTGVRQLQPTFNHSGPFAHKIIRLAGWFDKVAPKHYGIITEFDCINTEGTPGSILLYT
jgi:hypothetical protein